MGLAQDTHAAVTQYEDAARAAVGVVGDLAAAVAGLTAQLAAHGPLGESTDPDVVRARARLVTARQCLVTAGEAVEASHTTARAYADQIFPR